MTETPRGKVIIGAQSRKRFENAIAQVNTIASLVAKGDDNKAEHYLLELVSAQVEYADGSSHAAKSLCNVASQCAEHFRFDFEIRCVKSAVEISPNDPVAMSYLGDIYKREGKFTEALECLDVAISLGGDIKAQAARADVYAEMGKYDLALKAYGDIPGGDQEASVMNAKADLLRHSGLLDDSLREYNRLESLGLGSSRTRSGRAEVFKRQGKLKEAASEYSLILEETTLSEYDRLVNTMSLAGVWLRHGMYTQALDSLNHLVKLRPFWTVAAIRRATAMAFVIDPAKAISELPQLKTSDTFKSWTVEFVRGLLLLKLRRPDDARAMFTSHDSQHSSASFDGQLRQLVIALWQLHDAERFRDKSKLELAHKTLSGTKGRVNDLLADTLRNVMSLHIAAIMNRNEECRRIADLLLRDATPDSKQETRAAISAIREGRFDDAQRFEIALAIRMTG